MNKEDYKKQIKQKFTERNLNGFANHTILADLMADICIEVVKEKCNLQNVMGLLPASNSEITTAFTDTKEISKPYGTTNGYVNTLRETLNEYGLDIYKRQ